MTEEELANALRQVRSSQDAVDANLGTMIRMVAGRLRHARQCSSALKTLKRELQDFDSRTYSWKNR